MNSITRQEQLRGLLLGTAVGDALGLPAEGLLRKTIARLGWQDHWHHRLLLRCGMISDDTEHTIFVAQALLSKGYSPAQFQRLLAWKLRFWLLALPAGVGAATARAIIKLWLGFPPRLSGVFSAGNGPAMRVAIIGAYAQDSVQMHDLVQRSTVLTHTDPKALTASLAVAKAAAFAIQQSELTTPVITSLLSQLQAIAPDDQDWQQLMHQIETQLAAKTSVEAFAIHLGFTKGISGYCYQTVPMALYAWLLHWRDFAATLSAVLNCGGDTDTVGAIAGALAGATVGEQGIPKQWQTGICDWPRNPQLLRRIADALTTQSHQAVGYFWPAVLPRNLLFLLVVLLHGLLRLVPVPLRRWW